VAVDNYYQDCDPNHLQTAVVVVVGIVVVDLVKQKSMVPPLGNKIHCAVVGGAAGFGVEKVVVRVVP